MKAKIDTIAKTISIDEPMILDALNKFVKALFPNDWKEWKVDTNVKIEMSSPPIIVDRWHPRPWNDYWYATPHPGYTTTDGPITVLCGSSTVTDQPNGTCVTDWIERTDYGMTGISFLQTQNT